MQLHCCRPTHRRFWQWLPASCNPPPRYPQQGMLHHQCSLAWLCVSACVEGGEEETEASEEEDWRGAGSLWYSCADWLEASHSQSSAGPICRCEGGEFVDGWRCSRFMVSSRRDLEAWSKAHFTSKTRMERIFMLLAWVMSFGRHGAVSVAALDLVGSAR